MTPVHSPSLLEKLDIPVGILQALFGTFFTAFAAPFRGSNTPKTLRRHLLLSLCRKVLERLSPQQLQYVAGTTGSNYITWTRARHVVPSSILIPQFDTEAFWVGDPAAETTVIYYHGGGFAMPGSDGHFAFVSSMIDEASKAGKCVAALVLQYDLAPGSTYPRQHIQAVELLRYVLTELEKSPADVMLMGDSAGGNLVLGVLSHLMHPHPSIRPLKLSGPLKAAISCSPITVMNVDNNMFRAQEAQDPASATTIKLWLRNLLGVQNPDPWVEPLRNPAEWWIALGDVTDELLITVAANEMMSDDTLGLIQSIKSVYKNLQSFSSSIDFHAEPVIGPSLGLSMGETAQVLISYVIHTA